MRFLRSVLLAGVLSLGCKNNSVGHYFETERGMKDTKELYKRVEESIERRKKLEEAKKEEKQVNESYFLAVKPVSLKNFRLNGINNRASIRNYLKSRVENQYREAQSNIWIDERRKERGDRPDKISKTVALWYLIRAVSPEAREIEKVVESKAKKLVDKTGLDHVNIFYGHNRFDIEREDENSRKGVTFIAMEGIWEGAFYADSGRGIFYAGITSKGFKRKKR